MEAERPSSQLDLAEMRSSLLPKLSTALSQFTSSSHAFQIIHSLPAPSLTSPSPPPPASLLILDSSFNPPTRAHHAIALSALQSAAPSPPASTRLLLLLATNNADKAAQPAAFPQRLLMMAILGQELLTAVGSAPALAAIDIGLTTAPYFHDKAAAIAATPPYGAATQTHLVGYDTLVRILDPKYYDRERQLRVLDGFLGVHRLRVTKRTGASWGEDREQEEFLEGIRQGRLAEVGGKREWASRIELVEGRRGGAEVISSSKVREAVEKGEGDKALATLLTNGIKEWVMSEGLYKTE